MKKYLLWIITLAGTFSLGIGACVFYYFNSTPEIAKPELPIVKLEAVCSDDSKGFPGLSKEIDEIKKGKSDYFPKNLFGNNMSAKNSQAGWYARHLKAMNEKSLLDNSGESTETYRFLWLRSFHHPIFVRVERYNRYNIKIFTKELDGAGGYQPGKPFRSGEFEIYENEWNEFLALLDKADFWKMSSENEDLGPDGAQWILEGVKESRYHVVDRWSPRKGEYREACIYLLKLSGVDVDKLKDDLY